MMNSLLALTLIAASPQPGPAQSDIRLSLENVALLRCSAAFALISHRQANGEAAALQWPALDPRGREFFVRALARIMDETGMSREQVSQLAEAEAQRLIDQDRFDDVMPNCLLMLAASGV